MQLTKVRSLLLIAICSFGTMLVLIGMLGTSHALAHGVKSAESVNPLPLPQPPSDNWVVTVVFTDPTPIDIMDLSGEIVGKGVHEGSVQCKGNSCSKEIQLTYTIPLTEPWPMFSIEYKFTTRQAIDPTAERVVVAGVGTISGHGQKERFSFTATMQNNRDGTIWVRYDASRPDASFVVPSSPGTFAISPRR